MTLFSFDVAIIFLLLHQLDAVRKREWRMIPFLRRLSDETGYRVFLALHIPLFALLMWIAFFPGTEGLQLRMLLTGFCVVHGLLHVLYRNHPENRFDNPLSRILIGGAALFGAWHWSWML